MKTKNEVQKVSHTREIKTLLPDPTVEVSECTLSFVKCLLPKLKSTETLLLHREKKIPAKHLQLEITLADDPESSLLDTTGSPLEYELDYTKVDESIIDNRNWKKEEEFYLPLSKLEASLALNYCLEKLSDKEWSLPLLAVCDGNDNDKTVLFGCYVEKGWFTTIHGRCMNAQQLTDIAEIPALLLKEYTNSNSLQKHKVDITVCSTYEVWGKRPGVMDLSDFASGLFTGNLSIEVNWNTLSFYPPVRASTTTLIMEMIAGCDESNMKKLWGELTLLHQYLNMLEQSEPNEHNSYKFVHSNSITWDEIQEKLNLLLNGETESESYEDDNDEDHADNCKLQNNIDNVQLRQNRDFADMLWELLIDCADNVQLTNCLRMILEKVQLGLATPQISSTNSSRIARIVSEILCHKTVGPMLGGNLSLELLIDTGLEKIRRDYTYILLRSNLIDIHDIPRILCNVKAESNVESYRKKLTSLAQIHLCLEFTLFAENCRELQCSTANLHSIFLCAFQEYACENSAIQSFSHLCDKQIRRLNVSVPTVAVQHIAKGFPSSWSLTLSTESNTSKIITTSHLSRNAILPPNIYSFDELKKDEIYHSLNVHTASIKMT